MYRCLYDTSSGLYMPAFFRIDIQEPFDFDNWNNNTNHQKSILVHEYIHYLQDITTSYGFANFVSIANELHSYLFKAAAQTEINIKIPINIHDIENADIDGALRDIYQGDNENLACKRIDKISVEEYPYWPNETEIENTDVPEVLLHFEDKVYRFGGWCVTESMAHLIERTIYPCETLVNDMPYNACEKVCEFIYPAFAKRTDFLIALCDAALMFFHPGLAFYDTLVNMQKLNFMPSKLSEVYDFVYKMPKERRFDFIFNEALKNIDFLYSPKSINTQKLNNWLKEKFILGYNYRTHKNTSNFITNIVNAKSKQFAENYFFELVKEFGMPLITDIENNLYASNGIQDDVGLILVFGPLALRKLFSAISDNECEMLMFCKQQGLSKEVCKTKPWEMVNENGLCPLAQFWYHFGLEGKMIEKR